MGLYCFTFAQEIQLDWFGTAPNLAARLLLETSFKDCFICGNFSSTKIVVSFFSQSVDILASSRKRDKIVQLVANGPSKPMNTAIAHTMRLAQQGLIPSSTANTKVVKAVAAGLAEIALCHLLTKDHLTVAASGIAEVRFNKAFYILAGKFSIYSTHLPKHRNITYTKLLSSAIQERRVDIQKSFDTETLRSNAICIRIYTNIISPDTQQHSRSCSDDILQTHQKLYHTNDTKQDHLLQKQQSQRKKSATKPACQNYGKYRGCFFNKLPEFNFMWGRNPHPVSTAKHRIEIVGPSTLPVHSASYCIGPKTRGFEKTEITEMIGDKTRGPTQLKLRSSTITKSKKDGTLRFCVVDSQQNTFKKQKLHPDPQMKKCITSFRNETIFSTLDSNTGYWQTEIDERDRYKTAFTSHQALCCLKCMSPSLQNAQRIFQQTNDVVLSTIK